MTVEQYYTIMNDTGFFLQMRVAKEAREVFNIVEEEIAFEYRAETAKVDVLAEVSYLLVEGCFRAFVLIESKRHSHDYSSWIFFQPEVARKPAPPYVLAFGSFKHDECLDRFYSSSASSKSGAALTLGLMVYPFSRLAPLDVGYIGIEVKVSESKHRMEELTEVAKKVVTATHGMAMELEERARKNKESREDITVLVPIVVTTAKLFIAQADISKVALSDGKLAKEGLGLEDRPWIVYEYSLPAQLLLDVNTGRDRWDSEREDLLSRRHIFVVNSEHLREFLIHLNQNLTLRPA